jgi:hypothetical protein
MKVSTEIDNNFGYEKITQLVDNIPLISSCNFFELLFASIYDLNTMEILDVIILYDYIVRFGEKIKLRF